MQETMLLFRQRTKLSMRNQIFIFIFIFFFCCSVKKKDVRSLQTVSVVYALSNFRFLVCAKDSVNVRAACREKNVMLIRRMRLHPDIKISYANLCVDVTGDEKHATRVTSGA